MIELSKRTHTVTVERNFSCSANGWVAGFVLAFCASRPASLDTTIIIGLAPIENFESIAVNYNFRGSSTKARLLLCMTAN
jgi:hypothetical protein